MGRPESVQSLYLLKGWWGDVFGHPLKILFFTRSKFIIFETLNLTLSIGNTFNRKLYIV